MIVLPLVVAEKLVGVAGGEHDPGKVKLIELDRPLGPWALNARTANV
jgi:hypothetical protein